MTVLLIAGGVVVAVTTMLLGRRLRRLPRPGGRLARAWLTRHRAAAPAVALVAVAVAAYWFTLSSLADYLRLDTPLAYLLMLPAFSLLLAMVTVQRHRGSPPAPREPHVDLLIGIPLLVVATLLVALLPAAWSTYYWTERPDVLSLALFLSGGIVICYGFSWFWRLRASLAFIVLMWPAIYLHFIAGFLRSFTDGTNAVLTAVTEHLPLGVTSAEGGVLMVDTGAHGVLSVVLSTACSGANGVLGVVLVGSALACVLEGSRLLKGLWLVSGMIMVFALNIVRIISILLLARAGQPDLALGGYHAVIGLVLFSLTLLAMTAAAPLYRLRVPLLPGPAAVGAATPARVATLGRLRVPATAVLGLLAALTLLGERDLGSYAAFVDGTGAPTVRAFALDADRVPHGWTVSHLAAYSWAQQYFGSGSRFDRYVLQYGGTHGNAWLDVVQTDDQGALDAYNLQSCFLFHNYTLHTTRRLDVGHGVTALLINYSDPETRTQWATVSWAWPVLDGHHATYERIALTTDLSGTRSGDMPDPEPSSGFHGLVLTLLNSFAGGSSDQTAAYTGADQALVGAAAAMVRSTVGGITS